MTIFADKALTLEELRRDRLLVVGRNYFPDITPHDDYLYGKLLSAEKEIERRLRVFLEPVEVLPESVAQADRDALDAAGTRWIEEPGYDMEPSFFRGDSWGFMQLRHRPVIAVTSVRFIYPSPFNGLFDVPADWVRIDKKYGHLRLVPTSQAFAAPLPMFIMQALTGGRTWPHFIHVRYQAGLNTAEHPDIVDLVKKVAVLNVVDDLYLPQSGSESIDGMSENFSLDASKFAEKIDAKVDRLQQSLHGVRMMVV